MTNFLVGLAIGFFITVATLWIAGVFNIEGERGDNEKDDE